MDKSGLSPVGRSNMLESHSKLGFPRDGRAPRAGENVSPVLCDFQVHEFASLHE